MLGDGSLSLFFFLSPLLKRLFERICRIFNKELQKAWHNART